MSTLAFALAATIKHDGHGGIADLLSTPEQALTWVHENNHLLTELLGQPLEAPPSAQPELLLMRRAVRGLFARAVAPGAPSKADADRLMDAGEALGVVNDAAARLGATYLEWEDEPRLRWRLRTKDPLELLTGAIGRSAIDFLAGPDRARLRACPAARCVKYFLQDDPRQTWCSPACGNRERVNRHYRKRAAG